MTIIVQCECGRTLRAPDQMAGRVANCICGQTVRLKKNSRSRQLDAVEPEFGEPDEDAQPAPVVRKRRSVQKREPQQTVFRPSNGRNVERGEAEDETPPPPVPSSRKKKRRQDKALAPERKRQQLEGFIPGLFRSLKFPLRTESMLAIGFMAIAYGIFTAVAGFMPFGMMGIRALAFLLLGTILILGYYAYFLLQIFRLASIDEDDMPITMDFDLDQILVDLWTWVGTVWWCSLPMGLYWMTMSRLVEWGYVPDLPWIAVTFIIVFAVCLFLFPMALISASLHTTIWAANPWTVVRSMLRAPLEYIATLSVFGTLCITVAIIGRVMPPVPSSVPFVSHTLTWVLEFYALTASAYGFGNFYYRNRKRIGWFGELPRPN